MKYTAKPLKQNHNVSAGHPLVELSWLLGGFIILLSLTFLLLSWMADWLITRTSVETEVQLLKHFHPQQQEVPHPALLAELPANSPLKHYPFKVFFIEDDDTINAMALPGGTILVYSGLIQQVGSENELTMILAHELGHYYHREHLRGLGRGLSVALLSALLFGDQSGMTEITSSLFLSTQASYSREQEANADRFALELLVKRYGHAGGATDFFIKMAQQESHLDFLSTHPAPLKRVQAIEAQITEQGLTKLAVEPLSLTLGTPAKAN